MTALVLHELATNALKHGALKDTAGKVEVAWRVKHDGAQEPILVLDWRESGVAMPPRPANKRGYGRKLIEQAMPFAAHAKTDLTFGEDGVRCHIELPLGDPENKGVPASI